MVVTDELMMNVLVRTLLVETAVRDVVAETEADAYWARTAGASSYKLKAYDPPQTVEFDASPAQKLLQFVDVVL